MRAFIIRPFGVKSGIDFDAVEAQLIAPALARLHIEGRTTGEVIEAGNIREDMFQMLLVSDVVVADISIDNANAYYELGIRHALREKRTFLIRAKGMTNDVPFDLRTDRYLAYDAATPGGSLAQLFEGLKATIASERQDSPVFRVLPELREQDRSRFLPLPREFREEVEYAAKSRLIGKLALLAYEAKESLWESEALRLVGREQFRAKVFEPASATFEDLRGIDPLDREANLLLGTIYQRLGDLAKSEVALRRVAGHPDASPKDRAEAFSLLGRNLKMQWRESWQGLPPERRRSQALRSPLLMQSYDAYVKGFRQDLNYFYSGLNALAMLTIVLKLAEGLKDEWVDLFSDRPEAERSTTQLETQRRLLAGAVEFSLHASKQYIQQTGQPDPWVEISLAEFCFLTSDGPGQVVHCYDTALAGQPDFMSDSVRTQLALYQELELLVNNVARVIEVLAPQATASATAQKSPRTILFTGHQVDAPRRKEPRFPADKGPLARAAIREAIEQEVHRYGSAVGLAGAASGGDILFHEVCAELGVATKLYLALPPESYVTESVAPGGPDWVARFYAIQSRFPSAPVLSRTKDLPGWLRHRAGYSIWQRNNLWMLNEALTAGPQHVTLIALWNGKAGDGPGGTADMIHIARERGAETRVLDSNAIFGLPVPSAPKEA
ncbi:MAG: hypothetical protein H0W08_26465 [Acidobacteria bacterium]|nr:hypothetical protein [Acidobacteriota bacterium]